jgi:hypothetical protein
LFILQIGVAGRLALLALPAALLILLCRVGGLPRALLALTLLAGLLALLFHVA